MRRNRALHSIYSTLSFFLGIGPTSFDTACINQQDLAERNAQVQYMRYVYGQAERVVVWLGLSSEWSGLAFSTLRHLGTLIELTKGFWSLPSQA